jgi:hypothetical protein
MAKHSSMSLFGEERVMCRGGKGLVASVYDEGTRTSWEDFASQHRMRVCTECSLLRAAELLMWRTEYDRKTEVEVAL